MKFIAIVWAAFLARRQARLHHRESRLHEHDQEAGHQRPDEVDGDAVVANGVGQLHRQRLFVRLRRVVVESLQGIVISFLFAGSLASSALSLAGSVSTNAFPAASTTVVLSPVAVPAGSGLGASSARAQITSFATYHGG